MESKFFFLISKSYLQTCDQCGWKGGICLHDGCGEGTGWNEATTAMTVAITTTKIDEEQATEEEKSAALSPEENEWTGEEE